MLVVLAPPFKVTLDRAAEAVLRGDGRARAADHVAPRLARQHGGLGRRVELELEAARLLEFALTAGRDVSSVESERARRGVGARKAVLGRLTVGF